MTKRILSSPWTGFFSFLVILLVAFQFSPSHSAPKKEDPDLAMREYMLKISRQLGVTCNHCHNVKNFKDESMPTWKIAKEHMKAVHLLNTEGFTSPRAPRADCYMCHQGKAKYQYTEPKGI
jgi:hypothetical protein